MESNETNGYIVIYVSMCFHSSAACLGMGSAREEAPGTAMGVTLAVTCFPLGRGGGRSQSIRGGEGKPGPWKPVAAPSVVTTPQDEREH